MEKDGRTSPKNSLINSINSKNTKNISPRKNITNRNKITIKNENKSKSPEDNHNIININNNNIGSSTCISLIESLTKELNLTKEKLILLEKENKNLRSHLLVLEKFLKPQFDTQVMLKQIILSDIIYDISDYDLFNKRLLRHNKRSVYNLIFKATIDGDKADAFHNVCDQYNNTLVLIKTDKGRRFGGFTYEKWEGEDVNKIDNRAFIFSLDKKKVFPIKKGEEAIGCYKLNGPDFCGWQIVVQDNFLSNKKCYTGEKDGNYQTEEDYEINGGEKYFGIIELEVFHLVLE